LGVNRVIQAIHSGGLKDNSRELPPPTAEIGWVAAVRHFVPIKDDTAICSRCCRDVREDRAQIAAKKP
jgi:hypothetical protein